MRTKTFCSHRPFTACDHHLAYGGRGKQTQENLQELASDAMLLAETGANTAIISSSVANQNAGFALVHWLGDTNIVSPN